MAEPRDLLETEEEQQVLQAEMCRLLGRSDCTSNGLRTGGSGAGLGILQRHHDYFEEMEHDEPHAMQLAAALSAGGSSSSSGSQASSSWPTLDAAIAAAEGQASDEPARDGMLSWMSFNSRWEQPRSSVETLLDLGSECTIEQLLDDENVVQELHSGNQRLQQFLSSPSAVCVLVQYVSRDPPEDVGAEERRRRPYVASELLAVGCDALADALAADEPLGLLWDFLEAEPDGPQAPGAALAGYFCASAASLLSRRPAQVTAYLRGRDLDRLLGRFFVWLEMRCFAELLTALLCAETFDHVVFPVDGLVQRLLACLEGEGEARGAAQSHLAFVFDSLLSRACSGGICYADELLRQLASPAFADALAGRLLANALECGGSLPSQAAADILTSAVAHLHGVRRDAELPSCATPTGFGSLEEAEQELSQPPGVPAAAQALMCALCEHLSGLCDILDMVASASDREGGSPSQEADTRRDLRQGIVLLLQAGGGEGSEADATGSKLGADALTEEQAAQMRELAERCPDVQEVLESRGWLETVPTDAAGAECGSLAQVLADLRSAAQRRRVLVNRPLPSCGPVALEVASLLAVLAKTAHPVFLEASLGARLLPRCGAALLACAWSSRLQYSLWSVLSELLGDEERGLPSVLDLVSDELFLRRAAIELRSKADVGYLGFLRLICTGLRKIGNSVPEVGDALAQVRGWSDVVIPELDATDKIQKESLGGPLPEASLSPTAGLDCLEAIRRALRDSGEGVELSPEDVRDLVEDDAETEQALEMFQFHKRRPSKDAPENVSETAPSELPTLGSCDELTERPTLGSGNELTFPPI